VSAGAVAGTPARTPRLAVNPIAWWSRPGGKSRENFDEAFTVLSDIGYRVVKADPLEGMSAGAYREWIDGYGLSPSISLFNSAFDETVDLPTELERAKAYAAVQTELGLDRTMVSSVAIPARMQRPAVGADFDADRLARAVESCGRVCEVLLAEGLRPFHHSHVGGVFETEEEITTLLDTLGPDLIGIAPDTGHLRWAGVDPAALITRYADRVGGMHLKDCFPDHLDAEPELSYRELSATRRLWAEPGLGVVDFAAVLAALPEDYDGDYMIEVDRPSLESLRDSHQLSYDWAVANLPVSA
jgi:inosose dehydratase